MIAGQSPRLTWRENSGGAKRTIEEAFDIARTFGVDVPDDVAFFEDEDNELNETMTARGPNVTKPAGSIVEWADLINSSTGKMPFLIWPDALRSDEAIVAILGHEMFELAALRNLLRKGKTTIEHFINEKRPDNPGNLHSQAWDYADALVERMRKGKKR